MATRKNAEEGIPDATELSSEKQGELVEEDGPISLPQVPKKEKSVPVPMPEDVPELPDVPPPETIEDRLLCLEADVAELKKVAGLGQVMTPGQMAAAQEVRAQEQADKVAKQAERELRRYVKKAGDFKKGLPAKDKKRAKELCAILGMDATPKKGLRWHYNIIPV